MSGVFRVLDYLPFFAADGIPCKVVSYSSPALYRWLYIQGAVRSGWKVVLADYLGFFYSLGAMLYVLLIVRRYDFVFIEKITPPKVWIRLLKKFNPQIIYDMDDPVFIKERERTDFIVKSSFRVCVGSHFLQDYVQSLNKQVVFLPTPVPLGNFSLVKKGGAEKKEHGINIGWVGTTTNLKYLDLLRYPLARILEKYPEAPKFILVGHVEQLGELKAVFSGFDLKLIPPIDPNAIAGVIGDFDIGVMPLFDGDLEKGKCASKALLYMAAQVPVVCSGVGENNYVIEDGVNGFLAVSDEDWFNKLSALIDDSELRLSMGRAGRATVEKKYATEVTYHILRQRVFVK